jgi:hypothetical protein
MKRVKKYTLLMLLAAGLSAEVCAARKKDDSQKKEGAQRQQEQQVQANETAQIEQINEHRQESSAFEGNTLGTSDAPKKEKPLFDQAINLTNNLALQQIKIDLNQEIVVKFSSNKLFDVFEIKKNGEISPIVKKCKLNEIKFDDEETLDLGRIDVVSKDFIAFTFGCFSRTDIKNDNAKFEDLCPKRKSIIFDVTQQSFIDSIKADTYDDTESFEVLQSDDLSLKKNQIMLKCGEKNYLYNVKSQDLIEINSIRDSRLCEQN